MALPATDNFNRADGAVGSNWTALQNSSAVASGHTIVSNQCKAIQGTGNYAFSFWNADTFGNDHYSQVVAANLAAYCGSMVRMPASGIVDGYLLFNTLGGSTSLYRLDDGGFALLQSGFTAPAVNSVMKLSAEGTAIKCYDDGVQMGTTQTDATYGTGRAGIFGYNDGSPVVGLVDDWEGGNVGGAPAPKEGYGVVALSLVATGVGDAPAPGFPAVDAFDRADGAIGADWIALQNVNTNAAGHEIVAGLARTVPSFWDDGYSVWGATSPNPNQYSKIVVKAYPVGVGVRWPASGIVDGYLWSDDGSESRLNRLDNGEFTLLIGGLATPALNSEIKLTIYGTVLRLYDDGVQLGTNKSDATYATGGPGIYALNDDASAVGLIDNWEGGLSTLVGDAIWEFTALTTPALEDLLMAVDDPSGTPISKKLLLSAFAALTVSTVVVQVKTVGSGTYTPTTGMKKVLAIAVGGGGAGAGGLNTDSAGGGGGGGGTCIRLLSAAQISTSKAYVVGAGGVASGAAATATTLDTAGALLNAGAGGAGTAGATFAAIGAQQAAGGAGGAASNGDLNIPGSPGEIGIVFSGTDGYGGVGGSSVFGFGGASPGVNTAGVVGQNYGGGGSGGHASATQDRDGGNGSPGILYLIEFIG